MVNRATWRLVTIRVAIAAYWLSMFLATHLPVQQVVDQLPTSDKHLHFISYGVLGAALPWWRWNAASSRHGRRGHRPLMLCLLILCYAALDEWLQIPVGRTAEWGDWLADAAGGLAGLTAGSWLRRRVTRPLID